MKVVALLLTIFFLAVHSAPAADLITNLPGVPGGVGSLNFQMYSGYVNIGTQSYNNSYFYWFVESQRSPSTVSSFASRLF